MQTDPTPDLDELLSPCGHERPRSASQLHGVCIFCWRDRGAKIRRERDELRARAEKAEADLAESKRLAEKAEARAIAEAVGARERMAAEVERLKKELAEARSSDAESLSMYHRARDRADALQAELAEATASRDRLQQVVEAFGDGGEKGPSVWAFIDEWPTLKEKAKALDELEAWTGVSDQRAATICCASARQVLLIEQIVTPDTIETLEWCGEGPTIAAAIRAALEKASRQGGK